MQIGPFLSFEQREEGLFERRARVAWRGRRKRSVPPPNTAAGERKVVSGYDASGCVQKRLVQRVLELANVAGPWVPKQSLAGFLGEPGLPNPEPLRVGKKKVARQGQNVVGPLA